MRLAIVMAATVAGAALFAALHPAPRDAYEAAATLVIPIRGTAASDVAPRTLQAAELVSQPSVVGEALERALQGSEPGKVLRGLEVESRPAAGVVRFSVRAGTAENATRLAESLARVTVEALQRGRSTGERFGLRILGDFETGPDEWASTGTGDRLAATGLVPGGRYGGSSFRVLCDVAAGCGAARVIDGRFRTGKPVTLTAWVRGRQPSRVLLALGSVAEATDRAVTKAAVDASWQRLEARWVPARDESRIFIAVNNAGPRLSDVDIDGVLLLTEGDRLSDAQEQRLFAERGYAYATPARVVGSRTGRTLRWAAIGAAAGLAVGLAAVVAWTFALRRRERLTAST